MVKRFIANISSVAYFGILVGAFISVICYMLWLYFVYIPKTRDLDNPVEPEARLRPGQVGAVCIPICLFIFAWTSRERYVDIPHLLMCVLMQLVANEPSSTVSIGLFLLSVQPFLPLDFTSLSSLS